MRYLIIISAALYIFALPIAIGASAANPRDDHFETITFSRSWCFGKCPAYSVVLRADGLLTFHGMFFTAVKGERQKQLRPNKFSELKSLILNVDIGSIDQYGCRSIPEDSPSVKIELQTASQILTVGHNYGCSEYEGEAQLLRLVDEVQSRLPIAEWIKGPNAK